MPIQTRLLTAADAPAWHALLVDGAARFPAAFLQGPDEAQAIPPDKRPHIVESGAWHGLFTADGTLIGIAALRPSDLPRLRHRATIGPFYVTPDHQGTGAADTFMEALAAHARSLGVAWIDLWVAASNLRALGFYRRHGFEEVARRPDAVRRDGLSETDILMTRHLEAAAPGG